MKHLHKDTVSSLLWNVFTVLLSVWAVSRPQWMGFTPAPCFHTSVLVVFWWYMEFYRTSFIEGRNFSQNLSKMLFGCLSIFYFLIISVIGTSNWEHRYQYLHKFPRKGCSNLYQSLTKTPKPKRGFFCVKVSIHLPSSISKVHGQRYVMHTNTWGMHCLGVLKSWAKGFDAFTPHISTIQKLLPAVTLATESWRKKKAPIFLFSAILPMRFLRFLKLC